ncbi:hypothetical protein OAG48_00080 [bacterium]|nr:hypothetical protein [bacterium]
MPTREPFQAGLVLLVQELLELREEVRRLTKTPEASVGIGVRHANRQRLDLVYEVVLGGDIGAEPVSGPCVSIPEVRVEPTEEVLRLPHVLESIPTIKRVDPRLLLEE